MSGQAGKVEVVAQCRVCGANLSGDRAATCGRAECRREVRKRVRLYGEALAALADAAKCYGELLIAVDEMEPGAAPPAEEHLKALRALELCAVAYAGAAARAGRLP